MCGRAGIQGQPFSGGQEYYCPRCDEVYSYPSPAEHVVNELMRAGATGAVVAQEGDLNELVGTMVTEGWTLSEAVYVRGKRIRYLISPDGA